MSGPTRIASLAGFDRILAGRDMGGIFKEGHVYDVREIEGVIMFTDLGEHALNSAFCGPNGKFASSFGVIMQDGKYLFTKDEYKHLTEKKK